MNSSPSSPPASFCVCEQCGGRLSVVMQTCLQHNGWRVRRRKCRKCAHTWYTLQSPEEKIIGQKLLWGSDGSVIGLLPQAESPEKEKI